MEFCWNELKNRRLKLTRGITFNEIIKAKIIKVDKHPKKKNQHVLLYEYQDYIWVVPYVIDKNHVFLKTIYKSRKYTKLYLRRQHEKKKKST